MSAPEIRPLGEADLSRAAVIEASAPEAWSETALREELASCCGRLYGLWDENILQAVAVLEKAADEISLLTFTVEPSCRRRGWGETLLQKALSLLAAEGAVRCFLEVRSQNAPALALYQKLGFAQVGLRRGFYHAPDDDALVLRLELS